jgi:hypothetical protein
MIDEQGRKSAQTKPASGLQWRRREVRNNRFLISSLFPFSLPYRPPCADRSQDAGDLKVEEMLTLDMMTAIDL